MTEYRQLKTTDGVPFFVLTHVQAVQGLTIASQKRSGLFSAEDKTKLDTIQTGAEKNNVTEEERAKWNQKQDSILTSPNGTKYKMIVTDKGEIKTTLVRREKR